MSNSLGGLLVEYRKRYKLAQEGLVEEAGVCRQTLSKYEHDKAVPKINTAIRVMNAYRIPKEVFVEKYVPVAINFSENKCKLTDLLDTICLIKLWTDEQMTEVIGKWKEYRSGFRISNKTKDDIIVLFGLDEDTVYKLINNSDTIKGRDVIYMAWNCVAYYDKAGSYSVDYAFARMLRDARGKRTLVSVCESGMFSRQMAAEYEAGKRVPSISLCNIIIKVYGIDRDEFIDKYKWLAYRDNRKDRSIVNLITWIRIYKLWTIKDISNAIGVYHVTAEIKDNYSKLIGGRLNAYFGISIDKIMDMWNRIDMCDCELMYMAEEAVEYFNSVYSNL